MPHAACQNRRRDSLSTQSMEPILVDSPGTLAEKHEDAVSEPAAVRLWLRLLTCSMTIEKRVRRRLAEEFDTTLPRFDVLAALDRRSEGMMMGELSQALLVTNANLTALARQLQSLGYLEMHRDPNDRRSWLVQITDSGRTHFREVATEHHHWIASMFAGMKADHSQQLYALLAELKESLAASAERS
ncbi:MarR family transcriptional regulator [Sphingomonas sp. dw_22]|uniref:MarR family winged helix-turn-helix transcriptional regulator n=1 Tax=Sphingomonas sp. dw_22 TaxID=2721175 RepID=UPI002115F5F8|nr:MarR family transcriptional regulator [Sphingomonas sp. dw_22]